MLIQIEHIDATARKMQRDAVRMSFHLPAPVERRDLRLTPLEPAAWPSLPIRQQIIA